MNNYAATRASQFTTCIFEGAVKPALFGSSHTDIGLPNTEISFATTSRELYSCHLGCNQSSSHGAFYCLAVAGDLSSAAPTLDSVVAVERVFPRSAVAFSDSAQKHAWLSLSRRRMRPLACLRCFSSISIGPAARSTPHPGYSFIHGLRYTP